MNAFRRALTAFLLAGLWVAAPVAAAPPERVLVFTKTAKFRHDAIPVAVTTLQRLVVGEGMAADQADGTDRGCSQQARRLQPAPSTTSPSASATSGAKPVSTPSPPPAWP